MRYWILLLIGGLLLTGTARAQDVSACTNFDPPDASALFYVGLGDVFSTEGQFANAQIAYDCSIERDPSFAMAYLNRGVAFAAQGDFESALDDYNRAIELDENLLAAYNNRGLLYTRDLNFSLALADFNLLIALDAEYVPAYHNRAMIYAAEANFELALTDLQQAISLDPTYAPAHQGLGAVYMALALQSYQTAEAINARPAQFDADETWNGILSTLVNDDLGVWFTLQALDQSFEDDTP